MNKVNKQRHEQEKIQFLKYGQFLRVFELKSLTHIC